MSTQPPHVSSEEVAALASRSRARIKICATALAEPRSASARGAGTGAVGSAGSPGSDLWLCSTAGLPQVAYPRNQHDVAARATFKELSEMLESGPFRLRKLLLRDICDVFRQSSGIFLIHCSVVHAEDFELEDRLTESVPHYIV